MTLDELRAVLIPCALALRADFDPPTQKSYLRALKDVPATLLQSAVDTAYREPELKFFPIAPEWRGRCERERQRIMALDPYEACSACQGVGTVRVSGPGQLPPRYGRCDCWRAYLKRMSARGVPEVPLTALPAARDEVEDGTVLALDDVPPAISDRLRTLAKGKVLR